MIGVGPALRCEKLFGIVPVAVMGIEKIRWHHHASPSNHKFFSRAPSTSANERRRKQASR
jgi:hypothetical protein